MLSDRTELDETKSFHGLERHNESWWGMHYITVGDVKTEEKNWKVQHCKINLTPPTTKPPTAFRCYCKANKKRSVVSLSDKPELRKLSDRARTSPLLPRWALSRTSVLEPLCRAHKDGRRQSLGSHVPGGPRGPGEPGRPWEVIPGEPWRRIRHY